MNWMRRHEPPIERAIALASDVLPTPGTSSIEQVALGEQADEREVHRAALAAQHALDLRRERVEEVFERLLRAGRGLHRYRPPSGAARTTASRRPPPGTTGSPAATLPCPAWARPAATEP